jgi:hypothetical protein
MSQRSPKRVQPIPIIATLSFIPVAMVSSRIEVDWLISLLVLALG